MIFPLVIIDEPLWSSESTAILVPVQTLPEPYRSLLAHTAHMTVVVEDYFGQSVEVRVLASGRQDNFYWRRIILTLPDSTRAVQFGLVRIDLSLLPEPVRREILAERTPLGRVLIEHSVLRRVEPTAFLKITPGADLRDPLGMAEPVPLWGRTGVIFCNDCPAIAVLEILAPLEWRSNR